ncbi:MAG TPA: hypothetical protein VET88_03500, partial [Gammaproteobacteria bacterium]|nr:hypothetical protein [Gammaproteobacteria bacterium]
MSSAAARRTLTKHTLISLFTSHPSLCYLSLRVSPPAVRSEALAEQGIHELFGVKFPQVFNAFT